VIVHIVDIGGIVDQTLVLIINTFLGTVSIINISDKHIIFQYNSQFV
jgi:hypothetical protein